MANVIERFFADASRGITIGETRNENFAAGAAAFLSIGSLLYLMGIDRGWAQFCMGSGLICLGLWLGAALSENPPPLMFQLMTGAAAWLALVYFLFGGGF